MSSRLPRRCAMTALAAVLAFLAPVPARAAAPDVLDQIAASWRTDPVYLYPGLRTAFPAAELDRIRAAGRTAGFPVYVALLPESTYTHNARLDLPTLLQARIGGNGLFLVWLVDDDRWYGVEELIPAAGQRGRDLAEVQLDDKADNQLRNDRPAPELVRTIQQAGTVLDGRPLPEIPAGDLEEASGPADGMSRTDKENRSVFVGLGVGGAATFMLILARWLRRTPARGGRPELRPARGRSAGRGRVPMATGSVLQQAEARIRKAERSLRALDTRIASTAGDTAKLPRLLDQRDDAVRRLTAARLLTESGSDDNLTAAAGAFVLGGQAQQAATGATVQPPCFFDPMHAAGSAEIAWGDDGTTVAACRSCARTMRRGETPDGFLVWRESGLFRQDRTAVPYWTLDPADDPLVVTGFGALGDDLPERAAKQYGATR